MEVVRTRVELRAALDQLPRPLGLVPTMGWLHDGHRSLMRRSRTENASSAVSIFVNPRQFNSPDDFTRYPRSEARDLEICAAEGVDLVFAPSVEEIYVPGFDTKVMVGDISRPLEGSARPGHFDGVATVVAILFGLVEADRAYFGQKDYQQLRVIDRMTRDLAIGTAIVPCPTVREPDGLAMSSRNARLSSEARAAAPVVYRALRAAADLHAAGERSAAILRGAMRDALASEPQAAVEYVSCADAETLVELDTVDRPALLSVAADFGGVRLIDNLLVGG